MRPETLIRPRPGVVFQEVQGEGVLLDIRSGSYFGLNEAGVVLWRVVAAGRATVADLEAALRRSFGDAPESLGADLEVWVRELAQHELLEIR